MAQNFPDLNKWAYKFKKLTNGQGQYIQRHSHQNRPEESEGDDIFKW